MKFNLAVAILASSFANFALADKAQVSIEVACNGVDFHTLTKPEAAFSASMLQMAYNEVHDVADGKY